MRSLTDKEIQILSNTPGARKIAVENYLWSMGEDEWIARANLELDRKLYGWNEPTYRAIKKGIEIASKPSVERLERPGITCITCGRGAWEDGDGNIHCAGCGLEESRCICATTSKDGTTMDV